MSVAAALPAERARGASWASQLRSASDVVRDGGVVHGAPTFGNGGVTLDGVSDYLSYNIIPNDWSKDEFSCKIRFTPNFAADCGVDYYFYDTTGGTDRFLLAHSAGNALFLYLGGTFIGSAVLSQYEAHWKENEENTILITSSSGDTDMVLNGVQIMVNDATAWTPGAPVFLAVGANSIGAAKFLGTIHELKFFNKKLTDQEALDYCLSTQADSLLADWDMEDVKVAEWVAGGSAALSKVAGSPGGLGSQVLRVTKPAAGTQYAYQTTMTVGKRYRARGWARGDGTSTPWFRQSSIFGPAVIDIWTGTSSTTWQYFDIVFIASGTYNRIGTSTGAAANYVEFDDLKLMPDAHDPWKYREQAIVDLPMDLERADPANSKTLDISGNDRDGTIAGSTKNTRERGYLFDGVNDGITIPNEATFDALSALTVSCWMRHDPSQTGGLGDRYVVGKGSSYKDEPFICRYDQLNMDIEFLVYDGTTNKYATTPDSFNGQWFHFCGVFNGYNAALYINGILVNTTTDFAVPPVTLDTNTDPISIGDATGTLREFKGDISDVKLWNIALTPMQIADLYQRESGGRHRL